MHVVTLDQVGPEAWDEFCWQSGDAWFWHTTGWMRYLEAYKPELETRPVAFGVRMGERIVGVVPAMIERRGDPGGAWMLSAGGGPCWGPALADELDEAGRVAVFRLVLEHLELVARDQAAARGWMRLSPLCPASEQRLPLWLTEFTRAGWPDISLTSVVVDLSAGTERLWGGMRKGHRADIRRAERQLTVRIDDQHSLAPSLFATYEQLHRKAAGRVTRPKETFTLMEAWLAEGRAMLATALLEGQPVGCSYIYLYKDGAYYGSAATDPDAPNLPVGHLLQWEVMRWLVGQGFERYEIGIQQFGALPYDLPSDKERAISHFKRGFSGRLVPLVTRERFFVPGAGVQELRGRAERLAASAP